MKINLSFVPPNGGETDYSLRMELPEIPRAGDYISIFRDGTSGTEDFIVKRTWWQLSYTDGEIAGSVKEIWVECEFAQGDCSSEAHKRACESYQAKTGSLHIFDESMY